MAKDEREDTGEDQTTRSYVGNLREPYVERVEAEGIQPEDLDPGHPHINLALVGAGTIMPDGTYGPPMPDPMVAKLAAEAQELDTHGTDTDQPTGIQRKAAKKTATPKTPEPTA